MTFSTFLTLFLRDAVPVYRTEIETGENYASRVTYLGWQFRGKIWGGWRVESCITWTI